MDPLTITAITGLLGLGGQAGSAYLNSKREDRQAAAEAEQFAETMDLKNRDLSENKRQFDETLGLNKSRDQFSGATSLANLRQLLAPKPYDFLSSLSARYAGA